MAAITAEALDPAERARRMAEEERLLPELIRLGGIAPPRPGSDGKLHQRTARKIARGVVAGWIDWQDDVLRLLDKGAARALAHPDPEDPKHVPAPWVYLVGTLKNQIYPEREHPWDDTPPRRPK